MSYTVINDPSLRLEQYIESLKFYLNETNYKIVFVENTNTDISGFFQFEIDSRRLEILMFDGNNYPRYLGKGFGEMSIIEYAINNSFILKNNSDKYIVKLTGRIKIVNINDILNRLSKNIKADLKFTSTQLRTPNKSYSELIIAPYFFYKSFLINKKSMLNDSCGIYFEHILSLSLFQWVKNGNKFLDMPAFVKKEGSQGSTGVTYYPHIPFRNKIKLFIRHIINSLAFKILLYFKKFK